jgi:hypothetical protein
MKTPLKKFFKDGNIHSRHQDSNNNKKPNLKFLLHSKRQNSQQNLFKTRGVSANNREQSRIDEG